VGLARGGVVDERPVAAVILVADDKVEGGEHGHEKSLELQEGMTPVGDPVGVSERGPLGLVWEGKKKEVLELSRELGELDATGPTTLGAALDAGERSGPRWTGDAWLARRRRTSTARRDRAMT
jgi:hypothetical protein